MSAFFLSKQHWDAPWSVRAKKVRISRFSGRSVERPYCLMDSGKFDTPSPSGIAVAALWAERAGIMKVS